MPTVLHALAQHPGQTGSGVYFQHLINHMASLRGWRHIALYAGQSDLTPPHLSASSIVVPFERDGLSYPIVGMSDVMPYRSRIYATLSDAEISAWRHAFTDACDRAAAHKPDVIICHHLWWLCRLLLDRYPQTPIVAIAHGTDIRQARQHPDLAAQYVGSLSALARVIALDDGMRTEIASCFDVSPERIDVYGGAIDTACFHPPCHNKVHTPLRLLYAGKLSEAKGTPLLLDAFRLVHAHDPETRLHLIGQPDKAMRDAIARTNSDGAITVTKPCLPSALAQIMRASDLYVFPSLYEGLGLIALEALASGLSVVSHRLPALAQCLAHTAGDTPCVTWVDLPPLIGVDRIAPGAYETQVRRWVDALQAAIARRRAMTSLDQKTITAMQTLSWSHLASRMARLVQSLL